MFDNNTKEFYCNNCRKLIVEGEKVWTKWNFPPKSSSAQLKSRKQLEFENAYLLCLDCAKNCKTENQPTNL